MSGFVMFAVWLVVVGGSSGVALAHKDKLPPDALSLVRQAVALLAQDPKMSGEARERLEAALKSKDPRGVDLARVRRALDALTARNIGGARQALAEAMVPSSSTPPGRGVQPGASQEAGPSPSGQRSPEPGASPGQSTGAPEATARMKMAEPLITRYSGSAGEVMILLAGLALVVVGVATLRRGG